VLFSVSVPGGLGYRIYMAPLSGLSGEPGDRSSGVAEAARSDSELISSEQMKWRAHLDRMRRRRPCPSGEPRRVTLAIRTGEPQFGLAQTSSTATLRRTLEPPIALVAAASPRAGDLLLCRPFQHLFKGFAAQVGDVSLPGAGE
jgi:hypothetical protein